ncbi:FAD-dependent oxidoreductase [Mucilaginibacter sp. SMC90]|uniref:FAD-dependent oxidoreductase n=1 Tax=Mucilaginibacter sp. SMC90 TaxID=2929803 RepID=UPI001FB4A187|nr:FAD-dependent oxidoreductase [Mucilaginibacter sp. SMC90]UOE46228.1 FAD-dependent oxidoreductase [Mucilaginibacter sp. SMC90]
MLKEEFVPKRELRSVSVDADLVIVGGGLAGVCCAITAARAGLKVTLVQDRPVLGGNASSEVRLWVLGATSHMGNNNRWAREGGVLDELLVENMYRNPEGNPLIFDSILLDKVVAELNISLLLNTSIYEVEKKADDMIKSITGFCSQNATRYKLSAPLFCDCSGDGIVGFLSGAAFRMGAESKDEFGEKFAPASAYGELLGHSLYFYSKDVGHPVKYVPPAFALDDITKIPRFRSFNAQEYGCKLWWIEYGGRLDTVHDTEKIKWELWKVVYGTWNYIKNSGNFPEAANLTLEWVGTIPGKRESRRFEGDYMLTQQDIVKQNTHFDAVAYGGWSIDLHPADGVFSEKPGCNQWHSKGIYQMPYRSMYSKNISNLFLAGRIISASHVAFASTRVMATGAHAAQAVAIAAAICKVQGIMPADIISKDKIGELQKQLIKSGQYIPGIALQDEHDLVQSAQITASSELYIADMAVDANTFFLPLDTASAQLIPVDKGAFPQVSFELRAATDTEFKVELRTSSITGNFTPDRVIARRTFTLEKGRNRITVNFEFTVQEPEYFFLVFERKSEVGLLFTTQRFTGMLSVFNLVNKAVSNYGKQTPPEDIGVDEFEFWCPRRRPDGFNIALAFNPPLNVFNAEGISNGIDRPILTPNAWVAQTEDEAPAITLEWTEQQQISSIHLVFDTDFDHPMETVLMTHPENVMPFCVRNYRITDGEGKLIFEAMDNYQSRNIIRLETPVHTKKLIIYTEHPGSNVPAAIFAVRCYA